MKKKNTISSSQLLRYAGELQKFEFTTIESLVVEKAILAGLITDDYQTENLKKLAWVKSMSEYLECEFLLDEVEVGKGIQFAISSLNKLKKRRNTRVNEILKLLIQGIN